MVIHLIDWLELNEMQMAGELLKLFEQELDNPTRESLDKTGLTLVLYSVHKLIIQFQINKIIKKIMKY